jgi:hypothetical protein
MGRVSFFAVSTLVTLGTFGCGGSVTSGTGTTDTQGPRGTGGAAASDGSRDTGGVLPGKVSIEFKVIGPASYCSGCGLPPISLRDAEGRELMLSAGCDLDCETCAGLLPSCHSIICAAVNVTGQTLDWDGSYYTTSTCGAGKQCAQSVIAKPGRYTATMCASPGALNGPRTSSDTTCVLTEPAKCGSVGFEFPSSMVVEGTVGP